MIELTDYESEFIGSFSQTYNLLRQGCLMIHPSVYRITLHGSRGPAGGCRPDSDIDLALHVRHDQLPSVCSFADFLRQVLLTTLDEWNGKVKLDLAAVFDRSDCGLKCFDQGEWDENVCTSKGVDCLGIYKIQEGFDGFVSGPASEVRMMYPFLTIWRRLGHEPKI